MSDKEKNTFRLFENNEKEYHLAPCTFGRYQKIRMEQLKCMSISVQQKLEILQEFNLIEKKDKYLKRNYGIKGLFILYLDEMFLDVEADYDIDYLVISEINRAVKVFFP